jgi:hypothetical protein
VACIAVTPAGTVTALSPGVVTDPVGPAPYAGEATHTTASQLPAKTAITHIAKRFTADALVDPMIHLRRQTGPQAR